MNYGEEEDPTYLTSIHLDFDSEVNKGIFLEYSNTSNAYRVFNSTTLVVEESIHIYRLDRLINLILGDKSDGVETTSSFKNQASCTLVFEIEPNNIEEALKDDDWIVAMEEELHQFTRDNVWKLVLRPKHKSTIGTKWVFRNKFDENGKVIRNKARLVSQGYNQKEDINFTKTFAHVSTLEAIRILLAFVAYKDIKPF
ncbi:putative mitochondrial protein, partial [Mucuna pruriens]